MPRAKWHVAQLSSAGCALETVAVARLIKATKKATNIARVRFAIGSDLYKKRIPYLRVLTIPEKSVKKLCPTFTAVTSPLTPRPNVIGKVT